VLFSGILSFETQGTFKDALDERVFFCLRDRLDDLSDRQ
jgi:hypothetical protein